MSAPTTAPEPPKPPTLEELEAEFVRLQIFWSGRLGGMDELIALETRHRDSARILADRELRSLEARIEAARAAKAEAPAETPPARKQRKPKATPPPAPAPEAPAETPPAPEARPAGPLQFRPGGPPPRLKKRRKRA